MTKIQADNYKAYLKYQDFMERVEYYAEIDYLATNLDKSEVELTTFDDDVYIGILDNNPDMVVIQTCGGNYVVMKSNIKSIKGTDD